MKNLCFAILLITGVTTLAQSVNDYKYVIVSNQYEFQKEANEYRLNELMVFLLKKYGFEAYRNNEVLPPDMNLGICNAMRLEVDKKGTFWADITARLVDCNNNVLFETATARGREKDFEKAYFSATREAFESFQLAGYEYNGGNRKGITEKTEVNSILLAEQTAQKERGTTVAIDKSKELRQKELQKAIEQRIQSKRFDYEDTSPEEFALKFNDDGEAFELFQHGAVIGSGRKSAAGVYLVTAREFTGIGFIEGEEFIIEYDDQEKTNRIVLIK